MSMALPRYLKYLSLIVMFIAVLYKYEIPSGSSSDTKTLMLTKVATVPYDRAHAYQVITNINKYALWYPNVARVEHIQLVSSHVLNHEGEKYRLITRLPILGEMSSSLIIRTDDRPKKFIYSVDTWLLETNSIELKDSLTSSNATCIEWTVYTSRRSILFQYVLLPFANFYKNQIVREALFSLIMQIRDL
ncbi:unnamed protein product [Rotaria magnacalcarata]|uniref:Uncharacterized protein n=4 Tax=Rotaria magnacalcarata TaxID=392030 RepID=A0A816L2D3_9BILA|nr:unnamed protein product [Rotaria magnacalcarata]CAF1927253.1 unnamed protein product [Rotaria magnacalcarata]CAF1981613.1 unnamed protein product [Rotaria magnacalcarata]CAF1992155.1 unnamed protein product [Rotaria magnacalcarata]CAF3955802.1 unnamed protein product [Rotaria magnacalcarata]